MRYASSIFGEFADRENTSIEPGPSTMSRQDLEASSGINADRERR